MKGVASCGALGVRIATPPPLPPIPPTLNHRKRKKNIKNRVNEWAAWRVGYLCTFNLAAPKYHTGEPEKAYWIMSSTSSVPPLPLDHAAFGGASPSVINSYRITAVADRLASHLQSGNQHQYGPLDFHNQCLSLSRYFTSFLQFHFHFLIFYF